jgi:hypothetical protein
VEVRRVPEARGKPHTDDVDPGPLRITGKNRELRPGPGGPPRELIRGYPRLLKRIGQRGCADAERERERAYNACEDGDRCPPSELGDESLSLRSLQVFLQPIDARIVLWLLPPAS